MSGRGENKFLVSTRLSPNCIGGWWGCGGGEQVRFMRVGQRDEGKTNGRKGRASVIVRGCGATK